ncbi:MAG: hypothetical protein AB7O04_00030 [Hyphomonadaceae bacterium]
MLQHNVDEVRLEEAGVRPAGDARRAHAAHAVVVGAHAFCCGAPAALMLFAAGAGASIGVSAAQHWFAAAHFYIHAHELWLLAASAVFVLLGGWLEWRAHRGRRLSPLFALSMLCFALNAGIIWAHRDAHLPTAEIAATH